MLKIRYNIDTKKQYLLSQTEILGIVQIPVKNMCCVRACLFNVSVCEQLFDIFVLATAVTRTNTNCEKVDEKHKCDCNSLYSARGDKIGLRVF